MAGNFPLGVATQRRAHTSKRRENLHHASPARNLRGVVPGLKANVIPPSGVGAGTHKGRHTFPFIVRIRTHTAQQRLPSSSARLSDFTSWRPTSPVEAACGAPLMDSDQGPALAATLGGGQIKTNAPARISPSRGTWVARQRSNVYSRGAPCVQLCIRARKERSKE